ncbi:MAG: prepilin peptidase [Pirellulaceae bacterium]
MNQHPNQTLGKTGKKIRGVLWFSFVVFCVLVGLPFVVDSDVLIYGGNRPGANRLWWVGPVWMTGMIGFMALWIFFLGGCLASFLNVVSWRLPRNKSILGKSQCPNCGQALSLRENMPIVGWLQREGISKCCGLPIPSRYFWVEVLLGLVFLLIGVLEIGLLGINLPSWIGRALTNHSQIDMPTLVTLGSHLTVLSLLFTFTLFRFEGDRIPVSVFLIGLVFFAVFQFLLANSVWLGASRWPVTIASGPLLLKSGLALVGGGMLAGISAVLERAWLTPRSWVSFREYFFGFALIGLFIEIDAMILVFAGTAILSLGFVALQQFGNGTGWLAASHRIFVATILQLTIWRILTMGNLSQRLWDWIAN